MSLPAPSASNELHAPTAPIASSAAQNPASAFLKLPPELLNRILNLSLVEDVKRFRRVSKYAADAGAKVFQHLTIEDPRHIKDALRRFDGIIKSLTLSKNFLDDHFFNIELQELMKQRLAQLEVLDLYDCSQLTPSGIHAAVKQLPALNELKLPASMVIETVLRGFAQEFSPYLLQPFQHLKELDLAGPNMLFPAQITQILASLPELTHLNLSGLDQLNDEALVTALQHVPELTHLCVKDCSQLTPGGLGAALVHLSNLKYLELRQLPQFDAAEEPAPQEDGGDEAPAIPEAIIRILEHSPRLTHLVLRDCFEFTPDGLATALERVRDTLISLDLSFAHQLAGPALAHVLAQVPNLRELKLSGIENLSDADLAAALQRVTSLTHLEASALSDLTDAGVNIALQPMTSLTYLEMSLCDRLQHLDLPPLDSLRTLELGEAINLRSFSLKNIPFLQHLNLKGNSSLDMSEVNALSLSDVRDTLVTLNLSGIDLNDEQMPDLSGFNNLRRLDLSHNRELTDSALRNLPVLDQMNVIGCVKLTDKALEAVKANEIVQYPSS